MYKKILLILTYLFISNFIIAQCREFTLKDAVPKLGDFLLTGKYHSVELAEGEDIVIYKTINKGLTYRFVIIGENNIPQPHFIILNWDNKEIFNNEKANNATVFDYTCTKTQRIKIIIKIPEATQEVHTPAVGCVSLVMGIKS